MKDLDRIDEQDFEDAWLQHPLTLQKRKALEKRRVSALLSLLSGAMTSSDPTVRDAVAKYREVDLLVVELGGTKLTHEVK